MDFLKITGLTKGFRKKKAVKNVSLTVKPGEITTLFGPGESGKSTVLRCLAGLAQKDSGQILHGGNEMKSGKTDREIGFVPQKRVHLSGMTVRENMAYFAQIQGGKAGDMNEKVRASAAFAGMADRLDERVEKLSPEEDLRLCVAEALLACPRLLVADEPFQGMDPVAACAIGALFEKLKKEGTAVFIATQVWDIPLACDQWVFLGEGTVLVQGEPSQLMADYGAASARELYIKAWEQGIEKTEAKEDAPVEKAEETMEAAEPEEIASSETPMDESGVSGEGMAEAEKIEAVPEPEVILEEGPSTEEGLSDGPVSDEEDTSALEALSKDLLDETPSETPEETPEEPTTAVVKITSPTALVCVEESASPESGEDQQEAAKEKAEASASEGPAESVGETPEIQTVGKGDEQTPSVPEASQAEVTQIEKDKRQGSSSPRRGRTRKGGSVRLTRRSSSIGRGRSQGGSKAASRSKQHHLQSRHQRRMKKSSVTHLSRRKDRLS